MLSASNTKGANGAFIEFVESLEQYGFKPYIILPSAGPVVHELEIRSIPFKIFYYKWWMQTEDSPKWKWIARLVVNFIAFPRICYQMAKWQCDIVYTNTIVIGVGIFAAIILKKPHIFYVHEFGYMDDKLVFDFGENHSLWLANKFTRYFIFNSRAVAKEYSRLIEKSKIKVVYQSVTVPRNIPKLFNVKKHNLQCAIVGRLKESKGQKEAIEAIDILIKEGLDVGLWIVGIGDKEYKKYLEKIVSEKNSQDYIVFFGWQDNPFPFIQESDISLMCSKCEAFGRTTIEAMLLKKPVIASRAGANIELIKDGFNGFLYEPNNIKDLASKIIFLYKNPKKLKEMGKNAQKWAKQHFAKRKYVKNMIKILNKISKK